MAEAMKTLLPASLSSSSGRAAAASFVSTVVTFSLPWTPTTSAAAVPSSCSTRHTRRMPSAAAAAVLAMVLDAGAPRVGDRAGKAAVRKAAACPSWTRVVSASETCAMVSDAALCVCS